MPAPPESVSLPLPPLIEFASAFPVILTAFVRDEASITLTSAPTVTGDFVLSVTVMYSLKILTEDKLAAPINEIFPLPTVTMILSPLFLVEYEPPLIDSVDVALKP